MLALATGQYAHSDHGVGLDDCGDGFQTMCAEDAATVGFTSRHFSVTGSSNRGIRDDTCLVSAASALASQNISTHTTTTKINVPNATRTSMSGTPKSALDAFNFAPRTRPAPKEAEAVGAGTAGTAATAGTPKSALDAFNFAPRHISAVSASGPDVTVGVCDDDRDGGTPPASALDIYSMTNTRKGK